MIKDRIHLKTRLKIKMFERSTPFTLHCNIIDPKVDAKSLSFVSELTDERSQICHVSPNNNRAFNSKSPPQKTHSSQCIVHSHFVAYINSSIAYFQSSCFALVWVVAKLSSSPFLGEKFGFSLIKF